MTLKLKVFLLSTQWHAAWLVGLNEMKPNKIGENGDVVFRFGETRSCCLKYFSLRVLSAAAEKYVS